MSMIERARAFAAQAHGAQTRKYTNEPYTVHTEAVAAFVAERGYADEVVAVALLHDTLEDTAATAGELRERFGPEVARLVLEVTDVSRPEDGNRKARKALDRAHLARASAEGQTIKAADLLDNSGSIGQHDPEFARVYMPEKRAVLEVLIRADSVLVERAWAVVRAWEQENPPRSPR